MSTSIGPKSHSRSSHIRRERTGCKPCRGRGKKCDENTPSCKACSRLGLHCQYGLDFVFRNTTVEAYCRTQHQVPGTPVSPRSTATEQILFQHFDRQVRHILPSTLQGLAISKNTCVPLRFAILCLTASNLAILSAQVDRRDGFGDLRVSFHGPVINRYYQQCAQQFNDIVLACCNHSQKEISPDYVASVLIAKVLLAYYHHALTDHLRFRHAVWDAVYFVHANRQDLMNTFRGTAALRTWHRLCTSSRLSKPPALLLDGEGLGYHSPSLMLPDGNDHLHQMCTLNISAEDLIYDILVRTFELRSRMVMFKCASYVSGLAEDSPKLAEVAHDMLYKLMDMPREPREGTEAASSCARGSHLLELMRIQKRRLNVWENMVSSGRLSRSNYCSASRQGEGRMMSHCSDQEHLHSHRENMSHLYAGLCRLAFKEADEASLASTHGDLTDQSSDTGGSVADLTETVKGMFDMINALDISQTIHSDVYTFSLTEILVRVAHISHSSDVLSHILDDVWPRIEASGRGFEHSHIPTHLAKKIVLLIAAEWDKGRKILYSKLDVPEDFLKLSLMDISKSFNIAICGYDREGAYFMEKLSL